MTQHVVARRSRWRPGAPSAWARAADGVRVLALLSVVVGTWRSGVVGAALFLLVLGGCVVPLAVGVPGWLDAAYGGTLLLAAWAAQLDWYVAVGWLDVLVHAAATGLVAAVATLLLVRCGAVAAAPSPGVPRARLGVAALTAGLGAAGAVLWEVGEWCGHTLLDDRIQVGYADTLGDLAAGLAGSVVAAVLLARGSMLAEASR
jgi:hypothetical protein